MKYNAYTLGLRKYSSKPGALVSLMMRIMFSPVQVLVSYLQADDKFNANIKSVLNKVNEEFLV